MRVPVHRINVGRDGPAVALARHCVKPMQFDSREEFKRELF